MKIDVWLCAQPDGFDWRTSCEKAHIRKKKLSISDSKYYPVVEFNSDFDIPIFTEKRFNVFFKAEDGHGHDEFGMYYANVNLLNKFRLKWIFKKYWIQNNDNFKWIAGLIISFFFGAMAAKLFL